MAVRNETKIRIIKSMRDRAKIIDEEMEKLKQERQECEWVVQRLGGE